MCAPSLRKTDTPQHHPHHRAAPPRTTSSALPPLRHPHCTLHSPDRDDAPPPTGRPAMPQPQNSPYISFPGNGQEVLTHWHELFGGDLDLMTYDQIPDLSGFLFTPPKGAVSHATLTGGLF